MINHQMRAVLCVLAICQLSGSAQSVPPLMNYQGRLTDATGVALPDGAYRVAFKLWDDAMASSTNALTHLIWGREYDVTLIGGAFNVILGGGGGIAVPGAAVNDLGFAFSASNRFLSLTITREANGQAVPTPMEIVPRQQILSAPYAVLAQNLAQGSLKSAAVSPEFLLDILQPPGTINAYGGANIPDGWLLCDGRALSSVQYPRLFFAISTNWGIGSQGTTNDFNLPDLRGLFLRGVTGARTNEFGDPDFLTRTNSPSGGNRGNAPGSLQLDQFQDHKHKPPADFLQGDAGALAAGGSFGTRIYATGPVLPEANVRFGAETRPKNAYVHYIIKY